MVSALQLFRRACVQCPQVPTCPACAADEVCLLTTQSCTACPQTYCQKVTVTSPTPTPTAAPVPQKHSSTGAIVGGVVGGVVAAALIVLMLWMCFVRPRKRRVEQFTSEKAEYMDRSPTEAYDRSSQGTMSEMNRTHSVGNIIPGMVPGMPQGMAQGMPQRMTRSMPSSMTPGIAPISHLAPYNRNTTYTVSTASMSRSLTRSSNVIPIAYIPGVTTRTNVSPVPDDAQSSRTSEYNSIDYRDSTAVVTAAMMTAVQARPNLVDIGGMTHTPPNLQPDTEYSTPTNSPILPSPTKSVSAPALGLQAQYICEEDELSVSDSDDDQVSGIASNGFPKGLKSFSHSSISTYNQYPPSDTYNLYPPSGIHNLYPPTSSLDTYPATSSPASYPNTDRSYPATDTSSPATVLSFPPRSLHQKTTRPGSETVTIAVPDPAPISKTADSRPMSDASTIRPGGYDRSLRVSEVMTDLPIEALLYVKSEEGHH